MEVVSIRTFCDSTPFDRSQALVLIWLGALESVTYDRQTLITAASIEAVRELIRKNPDAAVSFTAFMKTFGPNTGA